MKRTYLVADVEYLANEHHDLCVAGTLGKARICQNTLLNHWEEEVHDLLELLAIRRYLKLERLHDRLQTPQARLDVEGVSAGDAVDQLLVEGRDRLAWLLLVPSRVVNLSHVVDDVLELRCDHFVTGCTNGVHGCEDAGLEEELVGVADRSLVIREELVHLLVHGPALVHRQLDQQSRLLTYRLRKLLSHKS